MPAQHRSAETNPNRRRGAPLAAACCCALLASGSAPAADGVTAPPNLVEISPTITTSGQPSAAWLRGLREAGYEAVIYLAPATVADAVAEEPRIVSGQGLLFANIPIDFRKPAAADLDAFIGIMNTLADRKVLVHCQINMRASVMTFLYRTIARREDPTAAYAAVTRVWVPEGPWRELITTQLGRHGIEFEPF